MKKLIISRAATFGRKPVNRFRHAALFAAALAVLNAPHPTMADRDFGPWYQTWLTLQWPLPAPGQLDFTNANLTIGGTGTNGALYVGQAGAGEGNIFLTGGIVTSFGTAGATTNILGNLQLQDDSDSLPVLQLQNFGGAPYDLWWGDNYYPASPLGWIDLDGNIVSSGALSLGGALTVTNATVVSQGLTVGNGITVSSNKAIEFTVLGANTNAFIGAGSSSGALHVWGSASNSYAFEFDAPTNTLGGAGRIKGTNGSWIDAIDSMGGLSVGTTNAAGQGNISAASNITAQVSISSAVVSATTFGGTNSYFGGNGGGLTNLQGTNIVLYTQITNLLSFGASVTNTSFAKYYTNTGVYKATVEFTAGASSTGAAAWGIYRFTNGTPIGQPLYAQSSYAESGTYYQTISFDVYPGWYFAASNVVGTTYSGQTNDVIVHMP